VEVYAHAQLVQTAGHVHIDLAGFWFIRWIRVYGLAGAAACGA